MRCQNCGWDNPQENTKCEKCNVPLSSSTDNNRERNNSSEAFEPRKTEQGCPECGYPMKPSDKKCPQCGFQIGGTVVEEPKNKVIPKANSTLSKGTVIGGGDVENKSDRKKLVGFLVTYSLDANGLYFPLYEGRNFIGRDAACSVCIQGDDKISGRHFSILYRSIDKKFKYRDEQSVNGTFINDNLSDEGELSDHDIIQIGSTKLITIIIPQ